ncbi:MAG: tetratricopeptide repeat protein [Accumulibacter sp.]|uniref:tetratricopeptide repeat protein n=1 Tax=Accumulibacter sp. TaxID=2053492 RepID=UPI002FC314E4
MLGNDHPDTLTTRNNVAGWTGQTGDARAALELYQALLPDQQRVLGNDHPETLRTRANLAHWTGETGDARAATALYQALLPDQQRVLGNDHPDTLRTRNAIATLDRLQGVGAVAHEELNSLPRNAPCPCGSGKRYKHCHGRVD